MESTVSDICVHNNLNSISDVYLHRGQGTSSSTPNGCGANTGNAAMSLLEKYANMNNGIDKAREEIIQIQQHIDKKREDVKDIKNQIKKMEYLTIRARQEAKEFTSASSTEREKGANANENANTDNYSNSNNLNHQQSRPIHQISDELSKNEKENSNLKLIKQQKQQKLTDFQRYIRERRTQFIEKSRMFRSSCTKIRLKLLRATTGTQNMCSHAEIFSCGKIETETEYSYNHYDTNNVVDTITFKAYAMSIKTDDTNYSDNPDLFSKSIFNDNYNSKYIDKHSRESDKGSSTDDHGDEKYLNEWISEIDDANVDCNHDDNEITDSVKLYRHLKNKNKIIHEHLKEFKKKRENELKVKQDRISRKEQLQLQLNRVRGDNNKLQEGITSLQSRTQEAVNDLQEKQRCLKISARSITNDDNSRTKTSSVCNTIPSQQQCRDTPANNNVTNINHNSNYCDRYNNNPIPTQYVTSIGHSQQLLKYQEQSRQPPNHENSNDNYNQQQQCDYQQHLNVNRQQQYNNDHQQQLHKRQQQQQIKNSSNVPFQVTRNPYANKRRKSNNGTPQPQSQQHPVGKNCVNNPYKICNSMNRNGRNDAIFEQQHPHRNTGGRVRVDRQFATSASLGVIGGAQLLSQQHQQQQEQPQHHKQLDNMDNNELNSNSSNWQRQPQQRENTNAKSATNKTGDDSYQQNSNSTIMIGPNIDSDSLRSIFSKNYSDGDINDGNAHRNSYSSSTKYDDDDDDDDDDDELLSYAGLSKGTNAKIQ